MNNQITATHEPSETTGLQQRKDLIAISISPETNHLGLTYKVTPLDLKGNPLPKLVEKQDTINFHARNEELPQDVQDFLETVYDASRVLFTKYGNIQAESESEVTDAE